MENEGGERAEKHGCAARAKPMDKNVEYLNREKKLLCHTTGDVLDGTVQERSCSSKFVCRVKMELELRYTGSLILVGQRLRSLSSKEASKFLHLSYRNCPKLESHCKESSMMYVLH